MKSPGAGFTKPIKFRGNYFKYMPHHLPVTMQIHFPAKSISVFDMHVLTFYLRKHESLTNDVDSFEQPTQHYENMFVQYAAISKSEKNIF